MFVHCNTIVGTLFISAYIGSSKDYIDIDYEPILI